MIFLKVGVKKPTKVVRHTFWLISLKVVVKKICKNSYNISKPYC